jgi:Glyoxalase/Bleomycin resistance protein/Dioxygenase superfamily
MRAHHTDVGDIDRGHNGRCPALDGVASAGCTRRRGHRLISVLDFRVRDMTCGIVSRAHAPQQRRYLRTRVDRVRASLAKATPLAGIDHAGWLPHLFFTTSDARKTYDELRAKDVEFTQEPTEQPYGIDFGMRDPFGNHIRVAQMFPVPAGAR